MNSKVFPIQNLPEEVLEHVLLFLPLADRKSASLVCKTWEKLAFSSRVLRKVTLKIPLAFKRKEIFEHRVGSTRRYRNLSVIVVKRDRYQHFLTYLMAILEVYGADVESFQCQAHLNLRELCMVLSCLPKLQQFTVVSKYSHWSQAYPSWGEMTALETTLHAMPIENVVVPSVTKLSTVINNPWEGQAFMHILRHLAPQLVNVDLFSMRYFFPLKELQFPKVEVLKMGGNLCTRQTELDLRTFFTGFKLLKEIILESNVKEIALHVLTKACPQIELLKFKVPRSRPVPFHLLRRLKFLKTLGLKEVNNVLEISLQGNALASVKNFSLELSECGRISIERLGHLLPNVTALDVTLKANWNFQVAMKHICRNFRGLQRLEISDQTTRRQTFSSSLAVLEHLHQLEELTFQAIRTRIVDMPLNPLLKRFVMKEPYWFSNYDLLELAKQYPNLQYLELGPGRRVSSWGIKAFKSKLVNCAVHCIPSALVLNDVETNYRQIMEMPEHMRTE